LDSDKVEHASELVIELAKALIEELLRCPEWQRGFLRFEASDSHTSANGSYVLPSGVFLLGVFEHKALFARANELFGQLRVATSTNGKLFQVCLLSVNSDFDFDIQYEYHDPNKWKITKLGGASGIPAGVS
jgi:hypothetical protein